jgi:hypothetical protein
MENLYYNVIKINISSGLNDEAIEIIGDGNYLILQYAPPNADVKIRLNNNFNPQILLYPNSGVEAAETKKIYVTANAIEGGQITFLHSKSSGDFRYIPPIMGKLDIGTVDSIKSLEKVESTVDVKVMNGFDIGGGGITLEKLYTDYDCICAHLSMPSESDTIDSYILEAEASIITDITAIDWDLFDYVYICVCVDMTNVQDITVTNLYNTWILSPLFANPESDSKDSIFVIDYIDNNINSAKGQVLTKIYHKDVVKRFVDIGRNLYVHSRQKDYIGTVYMSVNLYKQRVQNETEFDTGATLFFTDSVSSADLAFSINPQGNFKAFAAAKILFEINGQSYNIPFNIYGKRLKISNKLIDIHLNGSFYSFSLDVQYDADDENSNFNLYGYYGNAGNYDFRMQNIRFIVSYV